VTAVIISAVISHAAIVGVAIWATRHPYTEERKRIAANLDHAADTYAAQGRVETDWLTVSHAFRAAAATARKGGWS
jgi:P pilus assembly chaperone PapD